MKQLLTRSLVLSLVVLSGCSLFNNEDAMNTDTNPALDTSTPIELDQVPSQDAIVSVNYVGTLEDGTVFDTNIESEAKESNTYSEARTYTPLTFTMGQGQMIPGFEQGVVGMKVGETKTLTIPADQAYGEPSDDMILTTGASMFTDAGVQPVIGESYNFGGAPGTITSLSGDTVTIDFNHQLAGKTLIFEVTVTNIAPAQAVAQPSAVIQESNPAMIDESQETTNQ